MNISEILQDLDSGFRTNREFQRTLEKFLQCYGQEQKFVSGSGPDGLPVRLAIEMAGWAKKAGA